VLSGATCRGSAQKAAGIAFYLENGVARSCWSGARAFSNVVYGIAWLCRRSLEGGIALSAILTVRLSNTQIEERRLQFIIEARALPSICDNICEFVR
jgi:hypothetical protein